MTSYKSRFTDLSSEGNPYTLTQLVSIRGTIERTIEGLENPGFWTALDRWVGGQPEVLTPYRSNTAKDEFERNHPFIECQHIPAINYYRWALEYADQRIQQEVLK